MIPIRLITRVISSAVRTLTADASSSTLSNRAIAAAIDALHSPCTRSQVSLLPVTSIWPAVFCASRSQSNSDCEANCTPNGDILLFSLLFILGALLAVVFIIILSSFGTQDNPYGVNIGYCGLPLIWADT